MSRPKFKQAIADANDPSNNSISILKKKIAFSKLTKAIWNKIAKCFITKTLRAELILLIQIIEDEIIQWNIPLSQMIPRKPDYQAWGDLSLFEAGGYYIDLKFFLGTYSGLNIFNRNLSRSSIEKPSTMGKSLQ